ncbi:MAG: LysR substrate-binding domain-containing protein, partial [Pseudomonadota bacterium]
MAIDEKSLALFLHAAAEGGLARAGREIGLSPTATTQRLQALEAELGVKLLNRTTRAVSLTPEGALFIDHARRILGAYEEARTAMSGETGAVRGELRVTVSASFGRRYVAPQIAAFLAEHPDVSVKLQMTDAMVDIVEAGFDLAIRVGALPDSSLVAQRLAPSPRVVIASPAFVNRVGAPRTPADL